MKFRIIPSKKNNPTIQNLENGQYVHSLYDPIKEAKRTHEEIQKNYKDKLNLVLWGSGMSYVLEEILSSGPYPPAIYCFEPEEILNLEKVKKN